MVWLFDGKIKFKKLEIFPYDANCYIVACPISNQAVIIDTPGDCERIFAETADVFVRFIIVTHTHFDHLGAFKQIMEKLKATSAVHRKEIGRLPSPPDLVLDNGYEIKLCTLVLKVLHTPGYTSGSICLLTHKHLFSGDTLFPGGPGNTQNAKSFKIIVNSITQKLFVLPDDTLVHPGHSKDTILGKEKQEFEIFNKGSHKPHLYGDVLWLGNK